jgi:hypothetical protein
LGYYYSILNPFQIVKAKSGGRSSTHRNKNS